VVLNIRRELIERGGSSQLGLDLCRVTKAEVAALRLGARSPPPARNQLASVILSLAKDLLSP
jgi:hypothetical protein